MNGAKIIEYFSYFLGFVAFLVACSMPPYRIIAIIVIIIAVIMYVFYRIITLPPWTVIEIHRVIDIKRANGSLATATKKHNN